MKRLFFVLLTLALLWSGYWFVGSQGLNAGLSQWFDDRRAEGWQAEYTDLAVRGFPNRFDATFSDLALADPDTGLSYELPFFQLLTLSYQPNHIIAVWPPSQQIATPTDKFELASTGMRASLVLDPGISMPLNRANLESGALAMTSLGTGETATMEALNLAIQRVTGDTTAYRMAVSADGLAPSVPLRLQVDPGNLLPDRLTALRADIIVTFDRPWDIGAIESARPQPTLIDVTLAEAHWGDLHLQMAGKMSVDSTGQPTGKIVIKARNWRDILHLATAAGAMPQALADTIEQGLGLLAQLSGNAKTLDIPLDLSGGQMWLGPIPIGPSPVLILR
jgi:hypothetical protein